MPITSSAKKTLKRDNFLRERNDFFKTAMKRAIKALRKGVEAGLKKTELDGLLQKAYQAIDKAARRHIVHTNNAARNKSRLSKLITK